MKVKLNQKIQTRNPKVLKCLDRFPTVAALTKQSIKTSLGSLAKHLKQTYFKNILTKVVEQTLSPTPIK